MRYFLNHSVRRHLNDHKKWLIFLASSLPHGGPKWWKTLNVHVFFIFCQFLAILVNFNMKNQPKPKFFKSTPLGCSLAIFYLPAAAWGKILYWFKRYIFLSKWRSMIFKFHTERSMIYEMTSIISKTILCKCTWFWK